LLGWDGKFKDFGLERNDGIGRSQLAFGLLLGALAVIVGAIWLFRFAHGHQHNVHPNLARPKPNTIHAVFAVALIVFHGVTLGLVSHVLDTTISRYQNGGFENDANIAWNWSYTASIFAAMVAFAVAFTVLLFGRVTNGFGALLFTTGVIELAWAGNHYDQDTLQGGDFTDTFLAWVSFAVIASVFSIIGGLIFAFQAPTGAKDKDASRRAFSLVSLLVYLTMIGIVASLFQRNFLDRDANTYGTDMRQVDSNQGNYGNQVSGFAWEHSIWACAVAAAWAIEGLFGALSFGITALALTFSANLIGWAATHTYIGSVRYNLETGEQYDELRSRTRAWQGLALAASVITFLVTLHLLFSLKHDDANRPAETAQGEQSIDQHDREAFATKQGP
jgi:hypothetical protein